MMNPDEKQLTLRDLQNIASNSEPFEIMLKMMLAADHADRLWCVQRAVDYIAREMFKAPQHYQELNEDGLTNIVLSNLKSMGFQATHDTQYGGHCDIVIEAKDGFMWIAEAKIHRDYEWLLKGFQQLTTRYTTGVIGQDAGEIIIYINARRIDKIMESWASFLAKERPEVFIEYNKDDIRIVTKNIHERTGRVFTIRHTPISLYFNPKDSQ